MMIAPGEGVNRVVRVAFALSLVAALSSHETALNTEGTLIRTTFDGFFFAE